MTQPDYEQLTEANPDILLAAFVERFNDLMASHDEQATLITLLSQERDGYKRQCSTHQAELERLQAENQRCHTLAKEAEDIAQRSIALQRERDKLKTQMALLQQQLTQLKGGDSPKRLKEQNKRLKEANIKHQGRIDSLQKELKKQRQQVSTLTEQRNIATDKVSSLQKQLAHDTGSGLYHNGSHHLIVWPQKTKMQRPDGSIFEGRSLLYLHESGRGGLIAFDPESGTRLCAAPRGGLKPSQDCIEFAHDWLYKVNELQEGIVQEDDMVPVNYNGQQAA